jgi:hypothetical protein
MHGARQRKDLALSVIDIDRESRLPQQVREERADRAAADDGYVGTQECYRGDSLTAVM